MVKRQRMELLQKEYYAIILSKNKKTPEIALKLDQEENVVTTFFGYTGKKISSPATPRTVGEIVWNWRKEFLRVRFFQVYGNNNQLIPVNPDKAKDFFQSSDYILINNNLDKKLQLGIRKFLTDFQLKTIIRGFDNCPSCESNNKITVMQTQKVYESLKKQEICKQCALDEITQELHIKGVTVTPTVKAFINRFLGQNTRINEVLRIVSGDHSYGKDSKVTELVGEQLPAKPLELFPKIPQFIIDNIRRRKISTLLPAQYLSLEAGLLKNNDLLIVAETSAGKTLIGEIAALKTILQDKKRVLYLVPLVALANTKFESFVKSFEQESFKIGLRVGNERLLVVKKRKMHPETRNLEEKDIIIATYEGIDLLLRTGQKLKDIGLVIIDEIQTLGEEEDRGPILDGLISRLRLQKLPIQIIGLSATVGNPQYLAKELDMKLVKYKGRPTPLEIHVILVPSEDMKRNKIAEVIDKELQTTSSFGFKGQTMVFTNSRRKTKEIRDYLIGQRVRVANYHSGLAYSIRKQVEEAFDSGKLDSVVATYALGAGVDFPASTVIFESLQMGKELLINRTNIFFQMQGRAGRLGKHDKGKVVLLATPFPPNASTQVSEIDMAMSLIKSSHQDVHPEYDKDTSGTQILATMAYLGETDLNTLELNYHSLLGSTGPFLEVISLLKKKNLIRISKENNFVSITDLGKAGALSFLTIEEMTLVLNLLPERDYLEIAILLDPLENVHISPKLVGIIERNLQTRVKTRLFNSNVLDLVDKMNEISEKLDPNILQLLIAWFTKLFNCKCKDKPDCDCGKINVNKKILEYRLLGLSPSAISKQMDKELGLYIYPGDLLRWLEGTLYKLEGIEKIVHATKQDTAEIKKIIRALQIGISIEDVTIKVSDVKYRKKPKLDSKKRQELEKIIEVTQSEKLPSKPVSRISYSTDTDKPLPPRIIRALREHRKRVQSKEIKD